VEKMEITMDDKEIGTRIMALRKDKGYSREKLAELVGISEKFLYEIEIRKTGFSAKTLSGISQALDISSDYILFGRCSREFEERIARVTGKFELNSLNIVEELLNVAYELAHNN